MKETKITIIKVIPAQMTMMMKLTSRRGKKNKIMNNNYRWSSNSKICQSIDNWLIKDLCEFEVALNLLIKVRNIRICSIKLQGKDRWWIQISMMGFLNHRSCTTKRNYRLNLEKVDKWLLVVMEKILKLRIIIRVMVINI